MMFSNSSGNNGSPLSADFHLYSRIIAGCCIALLALSVGTGYSFGTLFTSLQDEFGWNRADTVGIFSIFLLVAVAVVPVALHFSNRYSPGPVALLAGIVAGLGLFLTSIAGSSWQIYLTYSLMLALGIGGIFSVAILTIARWFSRKQTTLLVITGAGLGIIIAAPVCGWLVSSYDWNDTCLVFGIIVWVIAIPLALFLKNPPREESGVDSSPQSTNISSRNFWMVFLLWLFSSFSLHMIMAHLIPNSIDQGISLCKASFLFSILGGLTIVSALIASSIPDMNDRKTLGIIFALVGAISMFWIVEADELWRLCLFAVMFAPVWGGISFCALSITPELWAGPDARIRIMIVVAGWVAGGALGAYLGGYIFDSLGDYRFAFFLGAWAVIIAAASIWNLRMPEPETDEMLTGGHDDETYSEL